MFNVWKKIWENISNYKIESRLTRVIWSFISIVLLIVLKFKYKKNVKNQKCISEQQMALIFFSLGRFTLRLRTGIKIRHDFFWIWISSMCAFCSPVISYCGRLGEPAISISVFLLLYSDCNSMQLVFPPKT